MIVPLKYIKNPINLFKSNQPPEIPILFHPKSHHGVAPPPAASSGAHDHSHLGPEFRQPWRFPWDFGTKILEICLGNQLNMGNPGDMVGKNPGKESCPKEM